VFDAESEGVEVLECSPVAQIAIIVAPVVLIADVVTGEEPEPELNPAAVCASNVICAVAGRGSSNARRSILFMRSPDIRPLHSRRGICRYRFRTPSSVRRIGSPRSTTSKPAAFIIRNLWDRNQPTPTSADMRGNALAHIYERLFDQVVGKHGHCRCDESSQENTDRW
jgi:hypothetical protein